MLGEQCWGKSKIKRESISCRMELEIEAVNGDSVGGETRSSRRAWSEKWVHSFANEPPTPLETAYRCVVLLFLFCYLFFSFFFFFNLESRRSECTDLKSEATPTEALFPLQTGRATIHEIDRSIEKDERAEKRAVARIPRKAWSVEDKGSKVAKKKKIGCEAKRGRGKRRRVVAARG